MLACWRLLATLDLAMAPIMPADSAHAQEISMLAACQSPNITQYFGSELQLGSADLMIIMELMDCSVADLVRPAWPDATKRTQVWLSAPNQARA